MAFHLWESALRQLKRKIKQIVGKELNEKIDVKINRISLGNHGASWTFCPDFINADSIIYSFGVGTDISFDTEMIKNFNVQIFAFDPTTRSVKWLQEQNLPNKFIHFNYALADYDGELTLSPPANPNDPSYRASELLPSHDKETFPCRRLSTLMRDLKHHHISLLKIDIEGAEVASLKNIIDEKIEIHQILVEFHHRFEVDGLKKVQNTIQMLRNADYKLFNISNNCLELSFISQKLLSSME